MSAASTGEVHRQASASVAASRRRDSGSPGVHNEAATKQAAATKLVRSSSLTHRLEGGNAWTRTIPMDGIFSL